MAMIGYLDAGSGSIIASVLVGGVAAAGVAVRQAGHKITGRFSRKRGSEPGMPESALDADEPAESEPAADTGADTAADTAAAD